MSHYLNWIKQLRRKTGLTQAQFAKKLGLSSTYITQIETGRRKPSVRVAKLIAAELKFDWTLFFEEDNNGRNT